MRQSISRTLVVFMLAVSAAAFAQDGSTPDTGQELYVPSHTLGDQTLEINLGGFVPLFYALADTASGFAPANLSFGGAGSLAWGSYLSNNVKVGVEVGGSFSFTPNFRSLFLVPIVAKGAYVFEAFPFEFPVSAGLGLSFARLDDLLKIDPFVKAGGSAYWNFSTQWAFGLNLQYWFIPQIYLSSTPAGSSETRLGNFLEVTLSALYHF